MRDACIRALAAGMGREPTPAEVRDIEARIRTHMRLLAQKDPQSWSALPEAERLREAGKAAAEELVREARLRVQRLEGRVLKMQAVESYVADQVTSGRDKYRVRAMDRLVSTRYDRANGRMPFEGGGVAEQAAGQFSAGIAQIVDLIEAGRKGIFRFIPTNAPGTNRMVLNALLGVTKNVPEELRAAIDAYRADVDSMRRRYNAAGGVIGALEDWALPHVWSARLMLRRARAAGQGDVSAGLDLIAEEFASAANERRYIHADGRQMSRDEIRAFMRAALDTIATDGANKAAEGERPEFARSIKANRHRAHREIHLRPEATAALLERYSEHGAMESIKNHMHTLARDTALIESFGANADLTWESMLAKAAAEDIVAFPEQRDSIRKWADDAQRTFDYVSGNVLPAGHYPLSTAGAVARGWIAFQSLGGAVWTSLGDIAPLYHTALVNGMNPALLWANEVAAFAGFGRRWARRAGLLTDTVVGYADRFAFDNMTARGLTSQAASFTTKTTGLNWVTEARRQAFSLTMMDALGSLVRRHADFAALQASDSGMLTQLQVSPETWAIWRLARRETLGLNHNVLSPQSIHAIPDAEIARVRPGEDPALVRQRAATTLLSIIKDEESLAVITPGARERANLTGATKAGTVIGELHRSVMMFKAFPWTVLQRHWERGAGMDNGFNRFAYRASLFVSMTLLGLLASWIDDLRNGRDLRSVNPANPNGRRNLFSAALKGGGLGIYGEALFAENPSGMNNSITATLSGPLVSRIEALDDVTRENLLDAALGEETNAGPEAVGFLRRYVSPNLWYAKTLMDRLIWDQLQEEMQPGYNARMNARANRVRGTSYWWAPGEAEPARAPDLSTAFGEEPRPN